MKKIFAALLFYTASLISCTTDQLESQTPAGQESETSRLKLRLGHTGSTRSSISPDEDLIQDICIFTYKADDGKLVSTHTTESVDEIDLELTPGRYNIYVTANMGSLNAPADESDIGNMQYFLNSILKLNEALPMCWKGSTELKSGESVTLYVQMSRLVSKIGFRVEMGALDGLEVSSVRLCQGAGIIRPFMAGGSRITRLSEVLNGDYASREDIAKLMNGETIYFYATENCQGTLLPNNRDPWDKVPDKIGPKWQFCTYLEMRGNWKRNADYEGYVTYRFFLGENAESNFDIKRNSLHDLTLYLEEDSFYKLSWKIDASQMDPADWAVKTHFENNLHKDGNFYVTENIRIDFALDEKGQRYWNKRGNAFTLAGVDRNGDTIIRFDQPVDCGAGTFQAMGTCLSYGDYDIVMTDSNTGEIEYILKSGSVRKPYIRTEDGGSGFFINGGSGQIDIYLTDEDGQNLNQSKYYGCDLSICNWETDLLNRQQGYSLYDIAEIKVLSGETGNDGYAARCMVSFKNDGKDEIRNRRLTESLGSDALLLTFTDLSSGAAETHGTGLYCDDIEIIFKPVPDAYMDILQTEFMYIIDNPAKLPLKIGGLKLNSMEKEPSQENIRPLLCTYISGNSSADPLLIAPMPYTLCTHEDRGAASVPIGKLTGYAADDMNIRQNTIPDQKAMFHTFDVSLAYGTGSWSPGYICKTDFYDSYSHSLLYGQGGFMNCGIILHSPHGKQELFDTKHNAEGNFQRYGDILSKESVARFNDVIEVDLSINDRNEIVATSSRNVDLQVYITGKLKGHIRCVSVQDPFYTIWGHYFTETLTFSNSGTYRVSGSTPVMVDGAALAGSFTQMRAKPYYSVLDVWDVEDFITPYTMIGTVREYLKPYDLEINIEITSTDGTPVAVSFSGSARHRHTISDPVTWHTGLLSTVTMVPSAYSGFDSRLDDDDCPPGDVFKAETVVLQPKITYGNTQNIYYMTL